MNTIVVIFTKSVLKLENKNKIYKYGVVNYIYNNKKNHSKRIFKEEFGTCLIFLLFDFCRKKLNSQVLY